MNGNDSICNFDYIKSSKYFLEQTQIVQVASKNAESDFLKYTKIINISKKEKSFISKCFCMCLFGGRKSKI